MRQITEHTILAMSDAMKEIEERGRIIERQQTALVNSQSLLAAMLLEKRPDREIEDQILENRSALTEV